MDPTQTPQDAPDTDQEDSQQDTPNVTPQEQAQYDTIVTGALKMIFDPKGIGQIITKLAAGGTQQIAQTIGHTAAMILQSLEGGVKQQRKDVDPAILFHAAGDVIQSLIEVAISCKLMTPEQTDDVTKRAMFEGLKVWQTKMQADGEMTPEVSQQAASDLKNMAQQGQQAGPPQGSQGIANAGLQGAQ